jgi:hypothetical protein
MPEPPSFDLNQVNKGAEAVNQPEDPTVRVLVGGKGAVPAGAVVRVTNLDALEDASADNATDQGSFLVYVRALDGEELRFEWADGERRSAPADARVLAPDPAANAFQLQPSQRFDCLRLEPGFVLDFTGDAPEAALTLRNDCDAAINLDNARSRLGLADFALPDNLPLDIAPGDSAELVVAFARSAASLREDILFVDVTLDAATIRYPITLRAP